MLANQSTASNLNVINNKQWKGTMDLDKTIGTLLREARETKGHSLKKISQHTKINLTLLEALEEDRLDKLPNKAYVVGFVKAYAHLVDLNPLDCIEVLNRTYNRGAIKPKKQRASLLKSNNQENSPALAMGLALVVLVLIGLTVVFLNSNREKIVQRPVVVTQKLTESTPLKIEGTQGLTVQPVRPVKQALPKELLVTAKTEMSMAPPDVLLQEQIMRLGEHDGNEIMSKQVASALSAAPAPSKAPVEIKVTKPTSPVIATPTETVKAVGTKPALQKEEKKEELKDVSLRPITDVMYNYVENGATESLNKFVPKNIQAAIVKNKQNVFIIAVDGDTWLTYKKDDEPIKRFTLIKDKSILLRGEELRIFLGNANVTRIFLNNKQIDVSSKNGVKSLVIPKERASKYKFPLFIYDNGQTLTSDEFLKKKEASTTP